MKIEGQPKPRVVRFFCAACGKEMWELADLEQTWDDKRIYPLGSLSILLVCSDCTLKEIRADRKGEA